MTFPSVSFSGASSIGDENGQMLDGSIPFPPRGSGLSIIRLTGKLPELQHRLHLGDFLFSLSETRKIPIRNSCFLNAKLAFHF